MEQQIHFNYQFPIDHNSEFGSIIIHSLENGKPALIYRDIKSESFINNLPQGCCVEVPCLVDREGVHPCYIGNLPPQVAALNLNNVNVQELAVRGIIGKNKNIILQSILLDPLTSAVLTIDETRNMVDEMFQGNKLFLRNYK